MLIKSQSYSTLSLVCLLAALSTIGPFTVVTVLPTMGAIGQSFNKSPEQVQFIIALYSICFGLMNLLHGALSDAIGRKKVIFIALTCYSLASFGCAFAPNLEILIAMRILQGLSGGAGAIVSKAIIRDCFSGIKAQKIMAHVTMIFSLAPAIAPIIGGQLLGQFGWQAIFLFLAFFGLTLLLCAYRQLSKVYPTEPKKKLNITLLSKNYQQLLLKPKFLLLSGTLTFSFVGMYLFIHSAHQILVYHFHIPETQFAWLFNPLVLGIISGAFCSGRIAGRVSDKTIAIIGYAIMLSSSLSMTVYHLYFQASLWMVILPLACYAFAAFFIVPSLTVSLMDIIPSLRGTASSLQSSMQSLCAGIISGIVAPLVWHDIASLAGTMLFFCLLSIMIGLIYFYLTPKKSVL
ncbi:multidrug effflux MFS transporter [Neisseria sp. Ec49-e6-T10]|uniref:multidrug effflux MFS transporter n=1 Tax=Neisseria sp. Ec49-e6-T10 TaxID=3140744 RepID=UPI003EB7187C